MKVCTGTFALVSAVLAALVAGLVVVVVWDNLPVLVEEFSTTVDYSHVETTMKEEDLDLANSNPWEEQQQNNPVGAQRALKSNTMKGLKQHCSGSDQCKKGFSCDASDKKCYNSPRRVGQPCKETGKSRCHQDLVCVEGKCREEEDDEDEEGCQKTINPVCVGGETTYENECLAVAQGEVEYEMGPCKGGHKKEHFHGSDLKISKAQMVKYRTQGFKLVGQVEVAKFPTDLKFVDDDVDDKSRRNLVEAGPTTDDPIEIHRVTPDGLHYIEKAHRIPVNMTVNETNIPEITQMPPMLPGFEVEDTTGRRLMVRVSDTGTYPHFRLGELDIFKGEGGCSGTIIAKDKVLTAAHCVYDNYDNKWHVPKFFAPGRKRVCKKECWNRLTMRRNSSWRWYKPWISPVLFIKVKQCKDVCSTPEPWGKWEVDSALVYKQYMNYKPSVPKTLGPHGTKWDVAVLQMKKRNGVSIGDMMGFIPMVPAECYKIDKKSTADGYPGKKPDGEMWSTGRCTDWWLGCEVGEDVERFIQSNCHAAPGMSGSGLLDSKNRLVGVLSTGGGNAEEGYNTNFAGLEQWIINDILLGGSVNTVTKERGKWRRHLRLEQSLDFAGIENVLGMCKNEGYNLYLLVEATYGNPHINMVAKPVGNKEGCRDALTLDDYGLGKRLISYTKNLRYGDDWEKDALPLGTFSLGQMKTAADSASVVLPVQYDTLTNNCANFVIDMMGFLKIPITNEVKQYVVNSLVTSSELVQEIIGGASDEVVIGSDGSKPLEGHKQKMWNFVSKYIEDYQKN